MNQKYNVNMQPWFWLRSEADKEGLPHYYIIEESIQQNLLLLEQLMPIWFAKSNTPRATGAEEQESGGF